MRLLGWLVFLASSCCAFADEAPKLSDARLQLMQKRAQALLFKGQGVPKKVEPKPLFRYDDLARGYQDGSVWRLGKKGRPLAIVTTELHPRYGFQGTKQSNPRVVYDLLSITSKKFRAASQDLNWTPQKSGIKLKPIPLLDIGKPEKTAGRRLLQLKALARRFSAIQTVDETGTEDQQLVLRLLPQNIDRYKPSDQPTADGAIFLFVAGRMPGVLLMLETDGTNWQYGIGRLSGPSKLSVSIGTKTVWAVNADNGSSTSGYYATNGPAVLPIER